MYCWAFATYDKFYKYKVKRITSYFLSSLFFPLFAFPKESHKRKEGPSPNAGPERCERKKIKNLIEQYPR